MNTSRLLRLIAAASITSLLAACSGVGTTPNAPASSLAGVPATFARSVAPASARKKTLYVTDAFGGSSFTGAVYSFDYQTAQSLGQLPQPPEGWLEVQGACVDAQGNAYFANTSESTIDKYAQSVYRSHLSDPGQFPVGCSYDPKSGDLAVANIINVSGGPGSISIYHGKTLLHTYSPPNMFRVYTVGYQGSAGVLWISGSDSSGTTVIDTFANGAFMPVIIKGLGSGTIGGGLQWSAKTHAMNSAGTTGSQEPVIWRFSSNGKIVGKTVLCSGSCSAGNFFIEGPNVATVNAVAPDVSLFDYPQGGSPTKTYDAAYVQPIAVVVTPADP